MVGLVYGVAGEQVVGKGVVSDEIKIIGYDLRGQVSAKFTVVHIHTQNCIRNLLVDNVNENISTRSYSKYASNVT